MAFSVVFLLACYILLINIINRCADGRIGINGIAGIRTSATMANEHTWLAGHQAARKPTLAGVYAAVLCLVPALFVPGGAWQATFVLGSCSILAIGVMLGAFRGSAAARAVLETLR